MLLVRTFIDPSSIHGIGLFAAERIPAGTPIWKFEDGFDVKIPVKVVERLPQSTQETIRKYAYRETDHYILSSDDARFINHAKPPNIVSPHGSDIDIAARDIDKGEELTMDYTSFDADSREVPQRWNNRM